MTYTVKLKHFEGPFDLLLFFIERDEIDIYDIPIATVTEDFLIYIREMEVLNIDLASEFILVAATLMRIKAKMLLPRRPLDEEGNEIDPRLELVERLIEYRRYKEVVEELREMEEKQLLRTERGNVSDELQMVANKALVDRELETLSLHKLMVTFYRLLEQSKAVKKPVHSIVRYDYTIQGQQQYVLSKLQKDSKTSFEHLFTGLENRVHAIVTFLAMLEMLNQQKISIVQGLGINNFYLSPAE